MKNHATRFFWILAISALCAWQIASKGLALGLDLKGGTSLTYQAGSDQGEVTPEKLEKALHVIDRRLNETGLAEVFVTSTTSNQIVVEMPGRSKSETEGIKRLIERNGDLEFRIVAGQTQMIEAREARRTGGDLYAPGANERWVPNAEAAPGQPSVETDLLVEVPEGEAKLRYERLLVGDPNCEAEPTKIARATYEELAEKNRFRGEDLKSVNVGMDGIVVGVHFDLKSHRADAFHDFTSRNRSRPMAIMLDGKVQSTPNILEPMREGGRITGGGSGFTKKEADDLAVVLESGSTGVRLELEREEGLSASLGAVAIERGKWSIAVGFAFVVAMMLWWYRKPGLVSVVALLLNVLIMLGIMAFFRGALSLPGIAGIVLTLGMAVDANILIFERIRDERARGKSIEESISAGYDRAMSAIIDSNVTTVLTAVILIFLGSGAVRGFGVTLTIGLAASMYTAIHVTRAIFEWAVSRGMIREFNLGSEPYRPKLDYMGARRWFTIPSIVLLAAGAVSFLLRDEADAKDIEFIGGQQVVLQLDQPVSTDEMQKIAQGDDLKYESATPVALATSTRGVPAGFSDRYQIRVKATSEAEGQEYVGYLRSRLANRLAKPPFADWKSESLVTGSADRKVTFTLHTAAPVADPAQLQKALSEAGLGAVAATIADGSDGRSVAVTLASTSRADAVIQDAVVKASRATSIALSDPFPGLAFLNSATAKASWTRAMEAVLLSLLIQIVYIRLRFADFSHGFAAVLALVHDACIALGFVALFDGLGLVYAKVNLTLIASFLTLIGFSMNDTIVVFDRMRENMGKNGVLRAKLVNDSINQTFARSIRTSLTTWIVVAVQFLFNRNLGSVLEGFAWVMVVGVIAGSYSSIFIAAPLLLFLPGYGRTLTANKPLLTGFVLVTIVGGIVAMTSQGHGLWTWVGFAAASVIPIHFLAHFIPWLSHPDPDSLFLESVAEVEDTRPLAPPGI